MNRNNAYEDKGLLLQVAEGNERAFITLMDYYSSKVYVHVQTYIKDRLLSEEITQDIFLKIWQNREQLTEVANFGGYLHIVTRNRTISELRKKFKVADYEVEESTEANVLSPLEQLEFRQLSDTLLNAIEKLPPRRRQVFKMSRFEGMSYEQIASQLNISKGTVNEHIVEALFFLRTYLKGQAGVVVVMATLICICLPE